jgi:hypothetical protein
MTRGDLDLWVQARPETGQIRLSVSGWRDRAAWKARDAPRLCDVRGADALGKPRRAAPDTFLSPEVRPASWHRRRRAAGASAQRALAFDTGEAGLFARRPRSTDGRAAGADRCGGPAGSAAVRMMPGWAV